MHKGEFKMSIMDKIKEQDQINENKKKEEYIYLDGDFAISKMANALSEFIFGYILRLNKNQDNVFRKVYGYVLLNNSYKKIELKEFEQGLEINMRSLDPYFKNHFAGDTPFRCFISESLYPTLTEDIHFTSKDSMAIWNCDYYKFKHADCSTARHDFKYGILYSDNQKVYLFPFWTQSKVNKNNRYDESGVIGEKLVSYGKESNMIALSKKMDLRFKEEGFTKSYFKVLTAKDCIRVNAKKYKYSLFGKKKYIGSDFYTIDNDPNSKVIYFEIEW